MDWSFEIDDPDAMLQKPPPEITAPLEAAAEAMAQASAQARRAADDLAVAVRTAASAGYGHSWIMGRSRLSSADVQRLISGEALY